MDSIALEHIASSYMTTDSEASIINFGGTVFNYDIVFLIHKNQQWFHSLSSAPIAKYNFLFKLKLLWERSVHVLLDERIFVHKFLISTHSIYRLYYYILLGSSVQVFNV